MPLTLGQEPLYACLNHQQNFAHRLGGGEGAPDWLPEGAVAGVDYTEGEAWLFNELITDLATIHGDGDNGNFDPAAITAAGMACTVANTNRPAATNELADVFLAMDFCVLIDWDQLGYTPVSGGSFIGAEETGGESDYLYTFIDPDTGAVIWADGNNGQANTIGTVAENVRNKIAASANAAGWLTSVNGATAVLDTPVTPTLNDAPLRVYIGCYTSGNEPLNGTIRRIIFYPNEQNAAFLEALSA